VIEGSHGCINNGKDWEMRNAAMRSEVPINLKNCTDVQVLSNYK
jgi:hypothetical protein